MIEVFESTARRNPDGVFLTCVYNDGTEEDCTYREARLLSAAIARRLQAKGVQPGDYVALDLPNGLEFALLTLAAAYVSFTLVALNHRLTAVEKTQRLLDLSHGGIEVACRINGVRASNLLQYARVSLSQGEAHAATHCDDGLDAKAFSHVSRQREAPAPRTRAVFGEQQDAQEDALHFAERSARLFDPTRPALVMFTSGTTGVPKAVELSWQQLGESAKASLQVLNPQGGGTWQAALPFYHIGGFQILVRALVGRMGVIIYERFDATQLLRDVRRLGATHVSVVDKMLQDLLAEKGKAALSDYRCILLGGGPLNQTTVEQAARLGAPVHASFGMTETASLVAESLVVPGFGGGMRLLPGYRIRIVDPDAAGFGRIAVQGPGVFSGYLNASAAFTVDGYFLTGDSGSYHEGRLFVRERTADMFISGGENIYPAEIAAALRALPGVADAHVFGVPDKKWGRRPVALVERAAIAGPDAAASGAQWAFSRAAALASSGAGASGSLRPASSGPLSAAASGSLSGALGGRSAATSGPLSGVTGGHSAASSGPLPGTSGSFSDARLLSAPPGAYALTPASVRFSLEGSLSPLYLPKQICLTDRLPRTAVGKVDRQAAERLYDERIEIDRIVLYHVRLPFKTPFKTAKTTLRHREVVLVKAIDREGRSGLGECSSFRTNWYLPEILDDDARLLANTLAPALMQQSFLHPREAARFLAQLPGAAEHPMACSALEMACWDLYGKITKRSLWDLIGEEYRRLDVINGTLGESEANQLTSMAVTEGPSALVAAGAVVGVGSVEETLRAVGACVDAGYVRIKLKVSPELGLEAVRAVRQVYPKLLITLDANQSFTETDTAELQSLDGLNIGWIEEPLALRRVTNCDDAFRQLTRLQRQLATPICLDESFTNAAEAYRALRYPELRCIALKVGKFGGIQQTIEFAHAAQTRGREVWMGGMYDTSISRRVHAAFQTIPGIIVPGDIGAPSRYFDANIVDPDYQVIQGHVALNPHGEPGIGCALNGNALESVLVRRMAIDGPGRR